MHLRFDTHTLATFKEQGISDVYVWIIQAGCAGMKVCFERKSDTTPSECQGYEQPSGLVVWSTQHDATYLDEGQIAVANGRTYFSSKKVQGRCGCGTSISFTKSSIDLSLAKIHRISEKLSTLPYIQSALHDRKKR